MTDTNTATPEMPEPDWDDALSKLVDDLHQEDEAMTAAADALGEGMADGTTAPEPSLEALVAERTADLQRLQAEYANYKKRVDRDRDLARQRGVEGVLAELLPVLDGIAAAETHDDFTAGTQMLADELGKVAGKHGLVAYGAEGDPFDPHIHEAMMKMDKPGYAVPSVAQVFQSGYRVGDRVIRPARVAVADPTVDEGSVNSAASAGHAVPTHSGTPATPADHATPTTPTTPGEPGARSAPTAGSPTHPTEESAGSTQE